MKIAIVNGPNLNLLGQREPEIYGGKSFDNYLIELRSAFPHLDLEYFQSNSEGEIVEALHRLDKTMDAIVLNAAAYTHTSVAIGDAVAAISTPVIEVHISNVHSRESFRQRSYIAAKAMGVVSGFGLYGYNLALEAILHKAD